VSELFVREGAMLRLPGELSDDQFFQFCVRNSEYRIERTAEGRVVVLPGAGGRTGNRNIDLSMQLQAWAKRDRRGVAFDSSTMFLLPNRAMRSPDAAWVLCSRLAQLSDRQKDRYLPLCPDFVVELTSPSDRLLTVQEKMIEWMANGCRLGWILHPVEREVHVYGPDGVEVIRGAENVTAGEPAGGFTLELSLIWNPRF
jgi:Uma2 family endonuclease